MPAPERNPTLLHCQLHCIANCAMCKPPTSMVMARTHYQGKNNARNLRAHKSNGKKSRSNGEANSSKSEVKIVNVDPSQFVPRTYCTACQRECHTRDGYKAHRKSAAHIAKVGIAPSTSDMPEKEPLPLQSMIAETPIKRDEPGPSQFVPRTYCTTCQTECHTRDEYKAHRKSTAHMAKAGMAPSTSHMPEHAENKPPLLQPVIAETPIKRGEPSPSQFAPRTYCTTCHRECHTRDEYKAHRKSTAHMANEGMALSTSEEKSLPLQPMIAETPMKRDEPGPSQFAPRTYCTTCQKEFQTRDEYMVHMRSTVHAASVIKALRKSSAHLEKAGMAPSTSNMSKKKPAKTSKKKGESSSSQLRFKKVKTPIKRGEPSQGCRRSSSKGTKFLFGGILRTVVPTQNELSSSNEELVPGYLNPEPSPSQSRQFAPRTYCLACQIECHTRDEYKAHRKSTAHMAKAGMALSTSDMPEKKPLPLQPMYCIAPKKKGRSSSSQFRSYKDLRTYCSTCQREFQTRDEYKVHMRSTAHAASVIKTENWTAHAAKAAKAPSTSYKPGKILEDHKSI